VLLRSHLEDTCEFTVFADIHCLLLNKFNREQNKYINTFILAVIEADNILIDSRADVYKN